MSKDNQRSLPGFEIEQPTIYTPPPAAKSKPDDPAPCVFCGGPGEYLCDYMLGQSSKGIFTCDAPMCGRCRKNISLGFACSRGRRAHGCQQMSIDHCPIHAPLGGLSPRDVITAEETELIRVTLWKGK